MKRTSSAIVLACLGLLIVPAAQAAEGQLPNVVPLQQRLDDQIRRMIDAGHLRPVYANATEHYQANMQAEYAENLHEYWHNPADTIYTLLRALPHVSESLREPLRQYIQSEWNFAPPTQYTHTGWSGAKREWADIPPELDDWFKNNPHAGRGNYAGAFKGWSFNPYNAYACWKYAEAFGGADEILKAIRPKIVALPDDKVLADRPNILNSYIAGYYGVLGLQKLASEQADQQVTQWLQDALAKRVKMLDVEAAALPTTEAGGFLFVVPELGDYLNQHARDAVARHVQAQERRVTPLWFLARVDEPTDMPTHTKFSEGSVSHLYPVSSIFNAKALALKEPRAVLERFLDGPAMRQGDLFYIQNLVSVLEAK